jgi:fructokinase
LAHSGQTQSSEHIVIQAQSGDRAADASLRRYEHRLARALAGIINVLDPDVIVLGGGLSKIERLYETVPKLWGEWVFTPSVTTKLLRNAHGDSSGVRGAAWLWD